MGNDFITGTYNIVVGAFDENDGAASLTVDLTDGGTGTTTEIGALILNQDLGSAVANAQTFVDPIVATGISLMPGDTITVNGFENGFTPGNTEHARFDFLQLIQVA